MKHITYSDKSVLLGDRMADLLIDYAAALTTAGAGDSVTVRATSSDGDEVDANFLLGPGAPIMSESTTSTAAEPDNAAAEREVQQKLDRLTGPNNAGPLEQTDDRFAGEDYGASEIDSGESGSPDSESASAGSSEEKPNESTS